MSEQFNQLSPAEAERLACLAEECGEVIQAIGKVLRHGYEDYSPFDETQTTNRQNLEREIGDLSAVIDTMRFANDLSDIRIHLAANQKLAKLPRWTHHQPNSEGMPPSPQPNLPGATDAYMRLITLFDQDATAASFLSEDGDGGFVGGVYRMVREIETLRIGIKRLSDEEELCGETMPEEDAFNLVRMAAKLATAEAANERLKKMLAGCDWYWPEDDTSSDACSNSPSEIAENHDVKPGEVFGYSRGGVVETRYYGFLEAAEDSDSDDQFEADEPTREAAEAKIAAEVERRAALATTEGSTP